LDNKETINELEKIKKRLDEMGCKCHKLKLLLDNGKNVVVKCGHCKFGMSKKLYESYDD
jgi:hypothetical protein